MIPLCSTVKIIQVSDTVRRTKLKYSRISYFFNTMQKPTVMQIEMHTFLLSPIFHSHAHFHPSISAVLNRGIGFRRSVILDRKNRNFILTEL